MSVKAVSVPASPAPAANATASDRPDGDRPRMALAAYALNLPWHATDSKLNQPLFDSILLATAIAMCPHGRLLERRAQRHDSQARLERQRVLLRHRAVHVRAGSRAVHSGHNSASSYKAERMIASARIWGIVGRTKRIQSRRATLGRDIHTACHRRQPDAFAAQQSLVSQKK
jgi:hypothetical protein